MPVDLFATRTMLESIELMKRPRRFLTLTFFGAQPVVSTSEYVDIDIFKGQRVLAPFVNPNLPGKVVDRGGAQTRSYKPAYVKPKLETQAGSLLNQRTPGEALYSGRSPLERAADRLGRDMAELDDQISRREEWMVAQALGTGAVRVKGDGVDDTVDYRMDAAHKITLAAAQQWTAEESDPIADLRKWKRQIAKDSGRTANAVVLSSEAADAFLANKTVNERLNSRRIDLGAIRPEELPDGVTYIGYLNDPGLDIYTYEEWFIDPETKVEAPMVPAGSLIMGPTASRNVMLYGAIQDMDAIEGGVFDVQRYPKTWVEKDPSVRWLLLQSAPLPGLHEPDAFITAKVV